MNKYNPQRVYFRNIDLDIHTNAHEEIQDMIVLGEKWGKHTVTNIQVSDWGTAMMVEIWDDDFLLSVIPMTNVIRLSYT